MNNVLTSIQTSNTAVVATKSASTSNNAFAGFVHVLLDSLFVVTAVLTCKPTAITVENAAIPAQANNTVAIEVVHTVCKKTTHVVILVVLRPLLVVVTTAASTWRPTNNIAASVAMPANAVNFVALEAARMLSVILKIAVGAE